MSTVVPLRAAAYRAPRLALLGTGVVGSALVARYQRLQSAGLALPPLAWLANSRALHDCAGAPQRALEEANGAAARRDDLPPWAEAEALHAGDIVIDATASDAVAGWHADWLSRGVHVVTANKLGAGSGWSRAQAIAQACAASGARYGDAATVGAGLPLLRSLRALVAGGDRIHRVEGMLSGSLAWLFNHYDGMRPFSGFVRQARQAGYTEPDPRIDLSGEDVRRKLLILARAAGLPLDSVDGALAQLDAPVAARFKEAYRNGGRLRFVGRFDRDRASVGLQVLPEDHPLCGGSGTDNRVAIYSDRYDEQPLVVQGPGAGAGITAAALLDDVLAIATAR